MITYYLNFTEMVRCVQHSCQIRKKIKKEIKHKIQNAHKVKAWQDWVSETVHHSAKLVYQRDAAARPSR